MINSLKNIVVLASLLLFLYSCGMGADARQFPPDAESRIKKNIEEGRGFRLMDGMKKGGSGNFDFASSNSLWRASLDAIDFMPLASANYSGGIIITDWYSSNSSLGESIKISIRFLTNEIRSDSLDIKIFSRQCSKTLINCKISELSGNLPIEMKKAILKKAAIYKTQKQEKNSDSNYTYPKVTDSKF